MDMYINNKYITTKIGMIHMKLNSRNKTGKILQKYTNDYMI